MGKRPKNRNRTPDVQEPRINEEIKGVNEVRLVYVDENGNNSNKVCSLREAFKVASDAGLDLIEISPNANPPVVKVGDYSKYFYELKKQAKAKNRNRNELREISLSVSISQHDLEIKAAKAREFIEKGDKVKAVLMMRKRELLRREENKRSILDFILMLADVAVPEAMPKDEGNRTVVILKRK